MDFSKIVMSISNKINKFLIYLFFLMVILPSCGVTKRLSDDEYLLTSNRLKLVYPDSLSKKSKLEKSVVREYIPINQIPNSSVLGYNLSLRIYQMANPESDSWFNNVIRKIGKAPIFYDSLSNAAALRNLKIYMDSEGFYNSKVTGGVSYKKKRAYVDYNIECGMPYFISSFRYNFADSTVMPYILNKSSEGLIKNGMLLSRDLLTKERERIAANLREVGFYYFSVGNIDYLIDTTKNKADVTLNINQRVVDREKVDNKLYKIGNIRVRLSNDNMAYQSDATKSVDRIVYDSVTYLYPTLIECVKPHIMSNLISFRPGDYARQSSENTTKSRLNMIPIFSNVSINFREVDSLANINDGVLDCDIQITQSLRQNFKVETEISTNNNYSGVSLLLGYANKNIFGGGETLNVGVTGGYDFMHGGDYKDSWEIGGNISVEVPRLLSPFEWSSIRSLSSISTVFELDFNSQKRTFYDRTTTTVAYGYSWNVGRLSYTYKPINISLIKVPWSDEAAIDSICNGNSYLKASYDPQLIAGSTLSVLYNNKNQNTNALSIRATLETSGNSLYLSSKLLAARENVDTLGNTYYNVLNTQYSQYIRGDLIFTYKKKVFKDLVLAYRFYSGLGYCYGNSIVLPIERQFYCGGGSSMRGWQIRTLGPGGSAEVVDALYPDQRGNIKLETNLEARFPLYHVIHGAIFFDMGNVWSNIKGDEENEDSRFNFNTFYKQFGFNTGLGVRLDFDFFVIRMDWGLQIYNPGLEAGSRWIDTFSFDNTALHFGVGYPF